ncbi:MAG: hypothetical protein HRJ53_16325, partial [Acidobacteria bacterium Pan2503]|nr:hypothetical protein [Candidatus Acidoferrum panamensis]
MPRSAVACDPIVLVAAGVLYFASPPLGAQWVNYPTPGVPRTSNGKVNLSAPTPRAPDGKPDLSGVWEAESGYFQNLAKDLRPDDVI